MREAYLGVPLEPQATSVEPTEPHHGGGIWLLSVFAALAIYVLSVGPAMRYFMLGSFRPPPHVLRTVYTPLTLLGQKIPTVQQSFNWYVDLWLPEPAPTPVKPPPPPATVAATN